MLYILVKIDFIQVVIVIKVVTIISVHVPQWFEYLTGQKVMHVVHCNLTRNYEWMGEQIA